MNNLENHNIVNWLRLFIDNFNINNRIVAIAYINIKHGSIRRGYAQFVVRWFFEPGDLKILR